jgi:hypothetical protein
MMAIKIIFTLIVLIVLSRPGLAETQKEEFPKLISYYDYTRLTRTEQEEYINGLRLLISDLSQMEQQRSVEFVAGGDRSKDRLQEILAESKAVLLLSRAFVEDALAATGAMSLLDKSCENGSGTQILCAATADGKESCFCQMSEKSLQENYCAKGQQCDWRKDDSAISDAQSLYEKRFINGEERWVTKKSIEGVRTALPPDFFQSLNQATRDREKSKVFKATPESRYIDVAKKLDDLVKTGGTNDPVTGIKTNHVYRVNSAAQDGRVLAGVANDKSVDAKVASPLTLSKNSDVSTSAQAIVAEDAKAAQKASDLAIEKTREADAEAKAKVDEAASEAPHSNDLHMMDANKAAVEAGASAGIVGATLESASGNLKSASSNMTSSKDPKVKALAADTKASSLSIAADAKSARSEGGSLLRDDSKMLADKAPAYSGDQQADLKRASADAAALGKQVEKGDITSIEKAEAKALDTNDQARKDLNLPPTHPSKAEGITCLKTGEFTCPDRGNRKKSQTQLDEMRTTYLSKQGDSKGCIFGGNPSNFEKDAKSRSNKTRVGCTAVTEKNFDINGKSVKLSCAAGKANEKLVLCSPILFGYTKDDSGQLVGRCTDWTSTVTADCNMKYPLHGARSKNGISPVDMLQDRNSKVEPEWQKLSETISSHCNTKEFRSLNCDECSVIAHRLSSMKARATAGTCTWPSDLEEVRKGMTSGSPSKTTK